MQIDRAAIFRFGKLADRTVDFAPGINIVYGKTIILTKEKKYIT